MPLAAALAVAAACFATAFVIGMAMMLPFFKRREAQRTLRTAIEHGQVLEPAVVEKILNPEPRGPGAGRRDMITGGVITIAAGIGLALFGLLASFADDDRSVFFALGGVGALVCVVGIGLLIAAALTGGRDLPDDRGA